MARGRPKKTGVDNEKFVCKCDLCNKKIACSPRSVRLSELTGCASWHREVSVERLNLCDKCAFALNKTIDSFILKKNKKLKKFS